MLSLIHILLAHGARSLIGHARSDRIRLLILVVHDLGMLRIAGEHRHHARAEIPVSYTHLLDARRAALGAYGGLALERAHLHAGGHGVGHVAICLLYTSRCV